MILIRNRLKGKQVVLPLNLNKILTEEKYFELCYTNILQVTLKSLFLVYTDLHCPLLMYLWISDVKLLFI